MKKQMKKEKQTAVIIGVVLLLCLMGAGIFAMTANSAEKKLADQLDLGRKYLDELDYERAIVAYGAAINIDPMNVEAYLGMAEAYEAMGDLDMALQILEQGYEKTRNGTPETMPQISGNKACRRRDSITLRYGSFSLFFNTATMEI